MDKDNEKLDPMGLILGMMVESSLEIGSKLNDLISKYEANNIDVVPIIELKKIISQGIDKTMEEGSFTRHLLGEKIDG